MAKKNTASPKVAAPALPVEYPRDAPWWPAEFAPFRFALIQGGFLVLLGILLYFSASTNGMLGLKVVVAWLLGVTNPTDLGANPGSLDICVLIWCFFLVLGNTLLHPSLGLLSLAFLRPWLDGYTFKTDNTYFLWGTILILALWGVRSLLRNEPLRFPLLTLLSAAYLLTALALSPWSYNFGETYKQLLNWTGYAAVFVVTVQNLTRQRTIQFVLVAVLVGMAGQALFAILQFHYVLPYLRELINQKPEVLRQFFGVDHVTPEMQHRFNKNRAFGTVLFPNALAAFLILGIPACAALAMNHLAAWRPFWAQRKLLIAPQDQAHRRSCIGAAALVWFVCVMIVFSALQFPATYFTGGPPPWYLDIYFLLGVSVLIGLLPAAKYFYFSSKHGFPMANATLLLACTTGSLLTMVWALWLSYSRGGTLALLGGLLLAGAVAVTPRSLLARMTRWVPRAAALLLCAGLAALLFTAAAPGAGAAFDTSLPALVNESHLGQARDNAVTRQGENVSFADLTNPESFALRLSYWRVALRIFADNWLTGVGLGNFKWAFAIYQQPGDGNVQEAHNNFLQALAETGILGGIALPLFWIMLLGWALGRIAIEDDAPRRRLMLALLAGLLAFLLHSAMDINFAHPTLMFYAMLFAGLFCVLAAGDTPPTTTASYRLPGIAAVLIAATFTVGLSTRPYFQNLVLSRMQFMAADASDALMDRYTVAQHILIGSPISRIKMTPPRPLTVRSLALFELDLQKYVSFSRVYEKAADGSGKLVPAADGTPIAPESQLLFLKPWKVAAEFSNDVQPYLQELEREDARFPHDPQLALHLSNWYQMLMHFPRTADSSNTLPDYTAALMLWSERAVERNPHNADIYVNLSRSELILWQNNPTDLAPLDRAIELRRKACALAPAQPAFLYELADALNTKGLHLRDSGDAEAAATLFTEEKQVRQAAWKLLRHGLPEREFKGLPPESGAPEHMTTNATQN